jgi:5-(carboxyamino)imidazole ribonucleotide mutase
MKKTLVGIVMGSDSDLPIMNQASDILDEFGITYEIKIASAHRSPEFTANYAKGAVRKGVKVIIAGAGGAAHLPGVIAAYVPIPVIGVPIESKSLKGMDSLLSIVQMPSGVPVATVAINNAKNAAILAATILATGDKKTLDKVIKYKEKIKRESINKNRKLK